MGKLSITQRVARPVINYLVERFFPNSVFFYYGGDDLFRAFADADQSKETPIGGMGMAAIFLCRRANSAGADSLSIVAKGVTVNTEDIGDWTVTVSRNTERTALAKEGE